MRARTRERGAVRGGESHDIAEDGLLGITIAIKATHAAATISHALACDGTYKPAQGGILHTLELLQDNAPGKWLGLKAEPSRKLRG